MQDFCLPCHAHSIGCEPTGRYNAAMPEIMTQPERAALFPVIREFHYLNNAWRGPISAPAAEAAKDYIDGLATRGVTAWDDWEAAFESAHTELAHFIGADRDEVQLLANATDAFTRVSLGFDWQPGDEVVAPANDYPGVLRPLLALERHGVIVRLVPARDDGSVSVAELIAAITPATRLLCASLVDFRTGFMLDAAALAKACRARKVAFALDCVQAVGALRLDLHALGCDFATVAARKYLNSLDALGGLYVRRDSLGLLRPHSAGTYSVREPFNFNQLRQEWAEGARRFMIGAPSMAQVYSLRAAMALQQQVGRDTIQTRVHELANLVEALAPSVGAKALRAAWPAANRSQIVTLVRPSRPFGPDTLEAMKRARVAASVRHGALRVSPHWYNSEPDVAALMSVLR